MHSAVDVCRHLNYAPFGIRMATIVYVKSGFRVNILVPIAIRSNG